MSRQGEITISEQEIIEAAALARPVRVRVFGNSKVNYFEFYSLKYRRPDLFNQHLCELRIGDEKFVLNVSDISQALGGM